MAEIIGFRLGGDGGQLSLDQNLIDKAAAKTSKRQAGAEVAGAD
jgi:hypothetical protein